MDAGQRRMHIESLSSMGRIVAVLKTRRDSDGDVFIPILQGGLLGQVDNSDTLRFPGLGHEETSFLDGVTTLGQLRELAVSGVRTAEWKHPRSP